MPTYIDFVRQVMENIWALDTEEKPVTKCCGQILARDIFSDLDLPSRDSSGPDGYAVRFDDVKNAAADNPVTLRIIETVKAGSIAKKEVTSGTAIRIMTGCLLPEGADCVVRFEDTDEPPDKNGPNPAKPRKVKVYMRENPEGNIRKAATTIKAGALLLEKGAYIGPGQISTLLSIGARSIKVVRRPVVAIISTGDELIDINHALIPGKVFDCNTAAVTALVSHYGGEPRLLGIARDNENSLLSKIEKGLDADAIITSGGVSRGDYDLVRLVIERAGKVVLSRINMGPGGSFTFGLANRRVEKEGSSLVPVFALSGPPIGCINNMEFFVRPAITRMRGLQEYHRPFVDATAEDPISNSKPVPFIVWTELKRIDGKYTVSFSPRQKSGFLTSMALANSQTILPPNALIKPGDIVPVTPLDWAASPN